VESCNSYIPAAASGITNVVAEARGRLGLRRHARRSASTDREQAQPRQEQALVVRHGTCCRQPRCGAQPADDACWQHPAREARARLHDDDERRCVDAVHVAHDLRRVPRPAHEQGEPTVCSTMQDGFAVHVGGG
jgi:hypothetical protein